MMARASPSNWRQLRAGPLVLLLILWCTAFGVALVAGSRRAPSSAGFHSVAATPTAQDSLTVQHLTPIPAPPALIGQGATASAPQAAAPAAARTAHAVASAGASSTSPSALGSDAQSHPSLGSFTGVHTAPPETSAPPSAVSGSSGTSHGSGSGTVPPVAPQAAPSPAAASTPTPDTSTTGAGTGTTSGGG